MNHLARDFRRWLRSEIQYSDSYFSALTSTAVKETLKRVLERFESDWKRAKRMERNAKARAITKRRKLEARIEEWERPTKKKVSKSKWSA